MTDNIRSLDLPEDLFPYIEENARKDTALLALQNKNKSYPFDLKFAFLQIDLRKKFKNKFPSLLNNRHFLFPDRIAAEQSSSEATALLHQKIAGEKINKVIDMTGGMGIDSIYLAQNARNLIVCEIEEERAKLLKHNFEALCLQNVDVKCVPSPDFLQETNEKFDLIFIDPARRDDNDRRVYSLNDCKPDIDEILPLMIRKADRIIVKCSPMLDITATEKKYKNLSVIFVIMVKGECKEILLEFNKKQDSSVDSSQNEPENISPVRKVINLNNTGEIIYELNLKGTGREGRIEYLKNESDIKIGNFIYEPDNGLMKFQPWKELVNLYLCLKKLSNDSHLFISDKLIEDFPGRILRITSLPNKKDIKRLKGEKINVLCRNYPLSADKLAESIKVKSGQDKFLIGTRIGSNPILLIAEKVPGN